MIWGLILVCSLSTPVADCKPNTAIDILRPPTKSYNSLWACMFESQAYAADVTRPGFFLKVYCGSKGTLKPNYVG